MGFYGTGRGHDDGTYRGQQLAAKHPQKPKRTVFPPDMVIHVWAQQTQAYGRSAKGSIFFDGPALYSYGTHYLLARFATPDVVLFNAAKDSKMTEEQKRTAWHAVKHKARFYVKNPAAKTPAEHAENLADIVERAEDAAAVALNPRSGFRQRAAAISNARAAAETARQYQRRFFPKRRKAPVVLPDLSAAERDAAQKEALARYKHAVSDFRAASHVSSKHYAAQALLKTAHALRASGMALPADFNAISLLKTYLYARHARAQLDALGVDRYAPGGTWGHGGTHPITTAQDSDDYRRVRIYTDAWRPRGLRLFERFACGMKTTAQLEAQDAQRARYEAQWQAEREESRRRIEAARAAATKTQAEKRAQWRRGERHNAQQDSDCMLRLSEDGADVQTSWGANFPAEHARRAWHLIQKIYASGKAWKTNGHRIPLGHFQIDAIDAAGTVTAGCHTIKRAEIENCARLLGFDVATAELV